MRALAGILVVVAMGILPDVAQAQTRQDAAGVSYRVRLQGGSRSLRRRLRPALYSLELQDFPTATPGLLRRRAEQDVDRLRRTLRSLGYYSATVRLRLNLEATPALVRFRIEPGPAYVVRDVRLVPVGDDAPPQRLPNPRQIGLPVGRPFEEAQVEQARERLVEWLRAAGHVAPEVRGHTVRVEHEDHSVHIVFEVAAGSLGRFGSTTISGLQSVRETYIRKLLPWREGDRFSSLRLQDLRESLTDSGLFSSVRLQAEAGEEPHDVNVRLEVAERLPRTVRVSAGYTTGPGPHLRLGWERRNLAGGGETLRFSTHLSAELRALDAQFRKPLFRRPDQDLLLGLTGTREDTDAYTGNSQRASAMIERRLSKRWTAAAGTALRRVAVGDAVGKSRFALVSTPLELIYDSSNDRLDPTRGMRLRLGADPTVDAANPDTNYLRQRADWSGYLPLTKSRRLSLATRVTLGSIWGAEHGEIPADERFYAGGGGSIRGYAYKGVGPRLDTESIGGRSLAESSLELRWRVTERAGVVAFMDGGNAFLDTLPRVGSDWYWGVGTGVRYFTPIGPLRFDVATPLDPEAGSSRVHFYVSIGQSF